MTTVHDPYAPVSPEIVARVEKLMKRPYRKVITSNAEEGFVMHVPDLPGCATAGETMEEAVELLPDAMMGWLTVALEHDDTIPSRAGPRTTAGASSCGCQSRCIADSWSAPKRKT